VKGKRVFVSGGAGVIGQQLVPLLVDAGAQVLVGDLKRCPAGFSRRVLYRQGDLNTITAEELSRFEPQVFIHLAATFERSTETYAFWEENFAHNVRLSHHLMTCLKDVASLERVVFASSYLIYDSALYEFDSSRESAFALSESDPVSPRNLTGMAKLSHEMELRFLAGFIGPKVSLVCARIFRGYGLGSRDVISRWIRSLLEGEEITVFRPEGLFDYIYCKDSAEGLLRLAKASEVTGIINLGTGQARRVQDVLDVLATHFPRMRARPVESDIPFEASCAELSRLRKCLDWVPGYALEDAIPEMIAFERERLAAPGPAPVGNVLLSAAAAKVPLLRSLQAAARKLHPECRVVAADLDPTALSRFVADGFWQMPRLDELDFEDLVSGLRKQAIRFVLPTRDGELEFWASHRERLAGVGVEVLVSPLASVRRCLDKLEFSLFGAAHSLEFIPSALHPAALGPGPYVVKERFGAGSRAIGLRLDLEAALAHAGTLSQPIFQPFVEGREISVDAWLDRRHRVKGLVLRHRDLVANGESVVTTTFRDGALEALAARCLEALELSGPVVMQMLVGDSGRAQVIECNSRFGGASTASLAAGLDGLYWSLLEADGGDCAAIPFLRANRELRQVRLPNDLYLDDHRV
jgi:carbamoyl-phosphate synthase large subunit